MNIVVVVVVVCTYRNTVYVQLSLFHSHSLSLDLFLSLQKIEFSCFIGKFAKRRIFKFSSRQVSISSALDIYIYVLEYNETQDLRFPVAIRL